MSDGMKKTTLDNGLRIVTEAMPSVRSATFGVWVGSGSREEIEGQAGSAHYLEHVPFKGTAHRTAMEISGAIEGVGGDINAFTSKEHTCFYARTIDSDLPIACDVIGELVTSPLLRDEDIEQERSVILEEIAMYDDNPADLIHDRFAEALFGADHSLGRPILGTIDTISALSPEAIREFYAGHYRPENMVVSVAGNIEHDAVVKMVSAKWQEWTERGAAARTSRSAPSPRPSRVAIEHKVTEQANIIIGVPGIAHDDERRWALSVMNLIFGGGMSSRLFDEVREKRGLAYSVYAYAQSFSDAGQFGVYVGCQPSKIDEAVSVVCEQWNLLRDRGLSDAEVAQGKGGVRGSTVLALEDTFSRMSRIGKGEVSGRPYLSTDEILQRIDAVTADDIAALAAQVLAPAKTVSVIGPFEADRSFALS